MRAAKGILVLGAALFFGVASIACGDDDIDGNGTSGGASGNISSSGGASGSLSSSGASGSLSSSGASGQSSSGASGGNEFVDYVKDQIVNHTRNNTPTDTLNDKTFTDSERSDLFDPAFFAGSYEQ